jgi:hypothetical protein
MRWLFRLVVLSLAVLGAKFLYDTVMSRRSELRGTADRLRDRTSSAAREMGASLADAAKTVAAQKEQIEETAVSQAREMQSALREAKDDVVADTGNAQAQGAV